MKVTLPINDSSGLPVRATSLNPHAPEFVPPHASHDEPVQGEANELSDTLPNSSKTTSKEDVRRIKDQGHCDKTRYHRSSEIDCSGAVIVAGQVYSRQLDVGRATAADGSSGRGKATMTRQSPGRGLHHRGLSGQGKEN